MRAVYKLYKSVLLSFQPQGGILKVKDFSLIFFKIGEMTKKE